MTQPTIYALSSGRPPAAIGLIRISGAGAHEAARSLSGTLPPARHAAVRDLRDPATHELLDRALLLRFDAPASATGEDSVELHCHGGRAVVEAVLSALGRIAGLRPAQPGEFTRRALEKGRIDLTEAEGLADLIEAETESQRRAALMMAEGGLRQQIETWRRTLVALSARAEAAIDYVDEDSVDTDPALAGDCAALAGEIEAWLDRPRAELLKDGVRIVIAGPPNAGKSSLLNALAGQERAIVTPIPGTTRDHIEVSLALGGVPMVLTDTAGLHEASDAVEKIGVDRARQLIDTADAIIWMGEADAAPVHHRVIAVHARCDLPDRGASPATSVAVSSTTGQGLGVLAARLASVAQDLLPAEGELALNRRQAECLREAYAALQHDGGGAVDMAVFADNLRAARMAFDRLSGRAGMDDVLDDLFGRFCLGK